MSSRFEKEQHGFEFVFRNNPKGINEISWNMEEVSLRKDTSNILSDSFNRLNSNSVSLKCCFTDQQVESLWTKLNIDYLSENVNLSESVVETHWKEWSKYLVFNPCLTERTILKHWEELELEHLLGNPSLPSHLVDVCSEMEEYIWIPGMAVPSVNVLEDYLLSGKYATASTYLLYNSLSENTNSPNKEFLLSKLDMIDKTSVGSSELLTPSLIDRYWNQLNISHLASTTPYPRHLLAYHKEDIKKSDISLNSNLTMSMVYEFPDSIDLKIASHSINMSECKVDDWIHLLDIRALAHNPTVPYEFVATNPWINWNGDMLSSRTYVF